MGIALERSPLVWVEWDEMTEDERAVYKTKSRQPRSTSVQRKYQPTEDPYGWSDYCKQQSSVIKIHRGGHWETRFI